MWSSCFVLPDHVKVFWGKLWCMLMYVWMARWVVLGGIVILYRWIRYSVKLTKMCTTYCYSHKHNGVDLKVLNIVYKIDIQFAWAIWHKTNVTQFLTVRAKHNNKVTFSFKLTNVSHKCTHSLFKTLPMKLIRRMTYKCCVVILLLMNEQLTFSNKIVFFVKSSCCIL